MGTGSESGTTVEMEWWWVVDGGFFAALENDSEGALSMTSVVGAGSGTW